MRVPIKEFSKLLIFIMMMVLTLLDTQDKLKIHLLGEAEVEVVEVEVEDNLLDLWDQLQEESLIIPSLII